MQKPTYFGHWLQKRRRELGLTQKDLAQHAGYAVVTIRKLESGERKPSRHLIERLFVPLEIVQSKQLDILRLALSELPPEAIDTQDTQLFTTGAVDTMVVSTQALTRDEKNMALQASNELWPLWYACGYFYEGRAWMESILGEKAGTKTTSVYATALTGASLLAWACEDYRSAYRRGAESIEVWQTLNDPIGLANALIAFGQALIGLNELEEGCTQLTTSLDLFRAHSDRVGIASALHNLGYARLNQGKTHEARVLLNESVLLFRTLGVKRQLAWVLNSAGELARYCRDDVEAEELYMESLRLLTELDQKVRIAQVQTNLGHIKRHQNEIVAAKQYFRESLSLRNALHTPLGIAECFVGLAGVAVSEGSVQRAACLCGMADSLLQYFRLHLDRTDYLEYQRIKTDVYAQIDEITWKARYEEGQRMSLTQAVRFGLDGG